MSVSVNITMSLGLTLGQIPTVRTVRAGFPFILIAWSLKLKTDNEVAVDHQSGQGCSVAHSVNPSTNIFSLQHCEFNLTQYNNNHSIRPSTSHTYTIPMLHLQWHVAMEFDKLQVDGGGAAASDNDTILHAHCLRRCTRVYKR